MARPIHSIRSMQASKSTLRAAKGAGGFSLVEILIAMLILSFGIISMGGLQMASLRSSQIASNFSVATTLSKDYTEMMRSNFSLSSNTSTTAGVNPYLFDTSNSSTFTASPLSASAACRSATCTQAQVSTLHVADWANRVTAQLPQGRAVVRRDNAPRNADGTYKWGCNNLGNEVTIKIGWIDKRDKEERGRTATIVLSPQNPQLVMLGLTGFAE